MCRALASLQPELIPLVMPFCSRPAVQKSANTLLMLSLHRLQLGELSAVQLAEQNELTAALRQLSADKAALQGRLEQAEAEAASLRRMVRMLKYGDSAAPSPMAGAAGGMPSPAALGAATVARRHKQLPSRPAATAATVSADNADFSDSGSSCPPRAEAPTAHPGTTGSSSGADGASGGSASSSPARQQQDSSRRAGGRTGGSDARARFLEEQVQSLTAALRRMQHQNRDLSAQLSEAGGPADGGARKGALLPLAAVGRGALQQQEAAGGASLRHELSGLAAENAELRRQLEEAEAEAGRAQWRMQQQQAEARVLHSQVVEVREWLPGGASWALLYFQLCKLLHWLGVRHASM